MITAENPQELLKAFNSHEFNSSSKHLFLCTSISPFLDRTTNWKSCKTNNVIFFLIIAWYCKAVLIAKVMTLAFEVFVILSAFRVLTPCSYLKWGILFFWGRKWREMWSLEYMVICGTPCFLLEMHKYSLGQAVRKVAPLGGRWWCPAFLQAGLVLPGLLALKQFGFSTNTELFF